MLSNGRIIEDPEEQRKLEEELNKRIPPISDEQWLKEFDKYSNEGLFAVLGGTFKATKMLSEGSIPFIPISIQRLERLSYLIGRELVRRTRAL